MYTALPAGKLDGGGWCSNGRKQLTLAVTFHSVHIAESHWCTAKIRLMCECADTKKLKCMKNWTQRLKCSFLSDDEGRGPTWPDKIQYVEQCICTRVILSLQTSSKSLLFLDTNPSSSNNLQSTRSQTGPTTHWTQPTAEKQWQLQKDQKLNCNASQQTQANRETVGGGRNQFSWFGIYADL